VRVLHQRGPPLRSPPRLITPFSLTPKIGIHEEDHQEGPLDQRRRRTAEGARDLRRHRKPDLPQDGKDEERRRDQEERARHRAAPPRRTQAQGEADQRPHREHDDDRHDGPDEEHGRVQGEDGPRGHVPDLSRQLMSFW